MARRARLTVAYDGAPFHGVAEADGVPTVMGALRRTINTITRGDVELVCAGRTDAGVHGWGQVISLDLADDTDLDDLARRVSRMLGPHIAVRAASWASPDFNARFSARWRHYRYDVLNAPVANPFLAAVSWHVAQPLHLPAMRLACDPLIGEHDFAAFCRRPRVVEGEPAASLVRRVVSASWHEMPTQWGDDVLRFEIRANAFCQQMVRSIVGTLVEVGLGKRSAGEIRRVLLSGDRQHAGKVAPAHGLCLWEVGYDPM
jgi:tRNA pseudouridine38-40 synthase